MLGFYVWLIIVFSYVTNLNVAMEKLGDAIARGDSSAVIALQPALRFNGGGHINHSIFWTNLAPPKNVGIYCLTLARHVSM